MEIIQKWKVSVTEILNESFFMNDDESDFFNDHSKMHKLMVSAATPGDAIQKAINHFENKKWYAIYCNEKIGHNKYLSHTKHNDELYDELYEKYCR